MLRRLALVLSLTLAVLACIEFASELPPSQVARPLASEATATLGDDSSLDEGTPSALSQATESPVAVIRTANLPGHRTFARDPLALFLLLSALVVLGFKTDISLQPARHQREHQLPGRHRLAIPHALQLRAPPRFPAFR